MKVKVKRIEQTGSFRATDEQGAWHTLYIFTSLLEADPSLGILSVQTIWTEDGERVERIGRGEYLTAWGEVLRSDDPDAP